MRLHSADVDRYGPIFDCRPPCGDGITVLSGPNEAGKTLYLEAVLKLLEPGVANVMAPSPRVDAEPTGRATVEIGGEQYDFDGSTALSDVSAIEPAHLQSVFVVRDTDLHLPTDRAYYTSLIQKLGDIHTTEIAAIQSELKERGRLTPTNHNVSRSEAHDNAGDVRDDAKRLADDLREYSAEIADRNLDDLDARRLRCKRRLRDATAELETLRNAQTVSEYVHLSRQLDSYRDASERLADLDGFDRDTLEELRGLQTEIERKRETLRETDAEIEERTAALRETEATLDDLQARVAELEHREPAADDARSALKTYRERQEAATGAERGVTLAKHATVAGMLAAGAAGVAGAVTGSAPAIALGVALLLVAVASALGYRRSSSRLTDRNRARETVLQAARDAGFEVDTVADVAPAIEDYENELERVRTRVAKNEQARQSAETEIEHLQDETAELADEIDELDRRRSDLLETAGVESIDEYERRVNTKEEAVRPDKRTARQSLVDRFGDPEPAEPAAKAASWQESLDALVADIDMNAVSAGAYDEDELRELEARVDSLRTDLAELQERLDDHDDALDTFADRASALRTTPFIGESLRLDSRSRDGLESLADDLESLVDEIETDAELSRQALTLFDRIATAEEQKLTTLFDPEGPASETFQQLTAGRYTEVLYDAESHGLVVERADGRRVPPSQLSQGTTDQLYFASRVSIAKQLLGNEPGFLLLDDPFLAADPERLRNGFESLQELASEGWQVLYLTAKQEVSETMVAEYDLEHTTMRPASDTS